MAAGPASRPSRLRAAAAAILGEGGRGRGGDVAGERRWRRGSPGEAPAPAPTCSSPPPPPSSASTCPSSPSAKRRQRRPAPRCCPPVRREGDREGGQRERWGCAGSRRSWHRREGAVGPGERSEPSWGSSQSPAGAPRGAVGLEGPVRVGWGSLSLMVITLLGITFSAFLRRLISSTSPSLMLLSVVLALIIALPAHRRVSAPIQCVLNVFAFFKPLSHVIFCFPGLKIAL